MQILEKIKYKIYFNTSFILLNCIYSSLFIVLNSLKKNSQYIKEHNNTLKTDYTCLARFECPR